jgi:hypothetical protein
MFVGEDGCRRGFRTNKPLDHDSIVTGLLRLEYPIVDACLTYRRMLYKSVRPSPIDGPGATLWLILQLALVTRYANLPTVIHLIRVHSDSIQGGSNQCQRQRRSRYAIVNARSMMSGGPEVEWASFLESWEVRPFLERVNDARKLFIGRYSRALIAAALERRSPGKILLYSLVLGCLSPWRLLRRAGSWLRR